MRSLGTEIPFVLMYHSISTYDEDPRGVTVRPERFEAQMAALHRWGFRGASIRELLAAKETGDASDLIGLTFDDGFEDFITIAVPILQRYGFTATAFVIADLLGRHNKWNPQGPRKALMTAEQVRRSDDLGMEIGSHSRQHVPLAGMSATALLNEVGGSREILEEVVGHRVSGFCYPYGDIDSQAVSAVAAAGYDYGCAIWPSALTSRYAIPRTYISDRDSAFRLRAKQLHHRVPLGRRRDRGPRKLARQVLYSLAMRTYR